MNQLGHSEEVCLFQTVQYQHHSPFEITTSFAFGQASSQELMAPKCESVQNFIVFSSTGLL